MYHWPRNDIYTTYRVRLRDRDGVQRDQPVLARNAEEATDQAMERYPGGSILSMTRDPWPTPSSRSRYV